MPSRYDPIAASHAAGLVAAAVTARRTGAYDLAVELEDRARRVSLRRAVSLAPPPRRPRNETTR